ncbi:hypothetical protein H0G86_011192 [Trichoderma simmonsii]|uniref:Uncharacterized protein n=1 Tax=Trichoderma simmonsii TaxID=1491479 RepID=A0A8G0LL41_9HYPO|nr:hypothetical protein H0G86_011192 [Trichoderma simmonsii]
MLQMFEDGPYRKEIRSKWSHLKEKLTPGRLRPLLEGVLKQLKRPNLPNPRVRRSSVSK